jgi:hypothetical protein
MIDVIGVGFGRTGTSSLQGALHQLGFAPSYHAGEVFAHPEHADHWVAAARGERGAWHRALDGYRASVDWPAVGFWRELVEAYPRAKVILTSRPADRWYASINETIFTTMRTRRTPAAVAEMFGGAANAERLARVAVLTGREVMIARSFDGSIDDRDHVLACYARHNDAVRREVPTERLLDYQVGQGWAPLCAFLGVPVPDAPFPHLNDRATLLAGDQR